jgi:hypothetical protein
MSLPYFNLHARGETIRMILHYHVVHFNERNFTFEEWIPVLEIDGERLVQSRSIVRYLCQKYGYYPSNPKKIYEV